MKQGLSGIIFLAFTLLVLSFLTPALLSGQALSDRSEPDRIIELLRIRDSSAITVAQEYLSMVTQEDDPALMAEACRLYGLALRQMEHSMSAIPIFLRERELRSNLGDRRGLAESNVNLGASYLAVFDPLKAEDHLRLAHEQFSEIGDSGGLARTLNRMAALRIDFPHPDGRDKGYQLAAESLKLADFAGDTDLQINNLILMAAWHRDKKENSLAIEHLLDAESRMVNAKEPFHLALVYINLGHVYRLSGAPARAAEYYHKGLSHATKTYTRVYIWLAGHGLGYAYEATGQPDSANLYMRIGLEARVQLLDEMRTWQKVIFEEELLRSDFEQQIRYQKERGRIWLIMLVIGVVFFTLAGIVISSKNRKLKQKNLDLARINKTIQEQSELLAQMNLVKDKFYSILAHDLRSPFSGMIGISELLDQEIAALSRPELKKLSVALHESILRVYGMLENLLDWSRIQQGSMNPSKKLLQVIEMVEECESYLLEWIRNKEIDLVKEITPQLAISADRMMLSSVIRNLLSNAVKFTPNGGKVELTARAHAGNGAIITISDTGIGMDETTMASFRSGEPVMGRTGTRGEPSAGIGLSIIREFVAQMKGTIQVESEVGKGTTFTLILPGQRE